MKYFTVAKVTVAGLLLGVLVCGFYLPVKALPLSWTNTSPSVASSQLDSLGGSGGYCDLSFESSQNGITLNGVSGTRTVCVSQGEHIKFGVSDSPSYTSVSFLNEQKMYIVNFGCSSAVPCSYIPAYDTLVSLRPVNGAYNGTEFTVYKNVTSRLSPAESEDFGKVYNFNESNPDYVLKSSTETLRAYSFSISESGRWITLPIVGNGLFRFDLETSALLKYSNKRPVYTTGNRQLYQDSITNDGRHIVIGGTNVGAEILDIANCGTELTPSNTSDEFYNNISNPCPMLSLSSRPDLTQHNLKSLHDPKFSKDGGELELLAQYTQQAPRRIVLHAASYTPPHRLDYLAMGDSYSSGEGDIERRPNGLKYYRPGTDVEGDFVGNIPEEKCHISARSYPYRLRQDMHSASVMSIACSGAQMKDIEGLSEYLGQARASGKPRLLEAPNRMQLQDEALVDFIPGRILQSSFIEAYKPDTATISIGGNDLDFGNKLKLCISNDPLANCSLTTEKGRAQLGKEIKALYPKLKELYKKLKISSRETQFYVVGYPQFVSRQFNNCAVNVALSPTERVMINEAVAYANDVIKAAANDSGMKYIDIEDSLSGHALCDFGESYVTGVSGYGISTEEQEMFHPNAKGHEAIFNKIKEGLGSQNIKTSTQCNQIIVCPTGSQQGSPSAPSYFAPSMSLYNQIFATYNMVKEGVGSAVGGSVVALKKGVNWIAEISPTAAKPTMSVRFELNSEPVDLGTFTSGVDGSVVATLNIPTSVPAGLHTLRMYGQTFSGEQVEYYQIIEVQGANGDIDEDAIADAQDPCMYIQAANADADFDGIDDACDPQISAQPQAYRARNGNVERGELPNSVYVERNTRASSVTGIASDDDPDGDGWALVATSSGEGTVANFWVDGSLVPHVSIRTAEDGCVQYTPTSLSVVLPGVSRPLSVEAPGATTCRAEAATDDLDSDGSPDNEQALYRVRNGVVAQGEDPARIYIERSTRAAEAQLGISDYAEAGVIAANGDTRNYWSVIGSSQDAGTQGVYNKMVMVNNSPVILAKDANNLCFAMQPVALTHIQQSNQLSRPLSLTPIPQGESCV